MCKLCDILGSVMEKYIARETDGSPGVRFVILNRKIGEGFSKKVIFEQRLEGGCGYLLLCYLRQGEQQIQRQEQAVYI